MTHEEKLNKMYQELPQKGIKGFAPPLYRLLWKMNIQIPPPYFWINLQINVDMWETLQSHKMDYEKINKFGTLCFCFTCIKLFF